MTKRSLLSADTVVRLLLQLLRMGPNSKRIIRRQQIVETLQRIGNHQGYGIIELEDKKAPVLPTEVARLLP